ncbi:hypothetical protein JOQ06_022508, partial [Pogonophryne albipinna]
MAMDGMMSTSSGLSYHNAGDYYPRKFGPKPDVVPSGVTERKVGPLDKPDMVSVDVINVTDSDVHMHRKKHEHDTYVLYLVTEALPLCHSNVTCNFDMLARRSAAGQPGAAADGQTGAAQRRGLKTLTLPSRRRVSVLNGLHIPHHLRPVQSHLAMLLTVCFCFLSVERFMEQPEVHTGRLLVGTFVALFFNLLTLLSVRNKPFTYVSEAASSSWLQEHVADLSRRKMASIDGIEITVQISVSLCGIIPGLSSVLLPRMNPFVLINVAGAISLCITYMLIEI